MAAADARAALSRSRVVARVLVHAAQVVGLVVILRALAEFPWAAAAAPTILRFAASFLAPPRLCFLVANAIVIFLATFFPRDAASLSPSFADFSGSPSSNGDALQQHPFLAFLEDPQLQALPRITESEPSGTGEQAPPPPEEEVPVFEDKQAVHVKTVRAQPPRRTMSEKTTRGGAAAAADRSSTTSAASPELRRAKSENGRRRQQRRSAAAAPAAAELGTDDAEAFRQAVEAFIAKQQTWFHREESMVIARAAGGGGAGGEDGPGKIAGAAAAVVVK
uniref:DUF4408 domain-containing protein n=1 Tax=Saccharum hybrid cultivar R570 TaxID=131158 RepID=A0A059Q185_9POAL|nr:hypothetical protein SHCRBa_012_A01_F_130 [Saccharum hybrid cultivar R570]